MSYSSIAEMVRSTSLRNRIAAAAATQPGIDTPAMWTDNHLWQIAASPGWADDWDYAVNTATVNVNPDTGERDDVISDSKILAAVQAVIAAP